VDDSEIFALVICAILAVVGMGATRTGALHHLYFRNNPAPGVVRLGVLLAMAWIAYVLWRHADPSVTGIYILFYVVMGFAAVKLFGQTAAQAYGARTRVDAAERRNVPAALFIATFTLATGLIFGGSLWGEADPVGDEEGGWWIPVSFFLLGWGSLLAVLALFLARERGRFRRRLRTDRSLPDARAAAMFLLASAWVLTDAVSGDFWGWSHALLTFGLLAGMLVVREVFALWSGRLERSTGTLKASGRLIETAFYLLIGIGMPGLERAIDQLFLGPR
jgi:hypothetical protein